jgi:cell division septum initiation protein DivIVA
MAEKEKYVRNLLEPMKDDLEKFTNELIAQSEEEDDLDRKVAIFIYAMSVKSFSRSGNWRRAILNTTKYLKAIDAAKQKKNHEEN